MQARAHERDLEEVSTGTLKVKLGLFLVKIHIFYLNLIPYLSHGQLVRT